MLSIGQLLPLMTPSSSGDERRVIVVQIPELPILLVLRALLVHQQALQCDVRMDFNISRGHLQRLSQRVVSVSDEMLQTQDILQMYERLSSITQLSLVRVSIRLNPTLQPSMVSL